MGRVDISEYLREYHETGEILVRAKWTIDGAESLEEAAIFLRLFADELDALADAGFHLMGPVEDDYGFAHRGDEGAPDERLATRHEDPSMRQLNEDAPARAPSNIGLMTPVVISTGNRTAPRGPTRDRRAERLERGRPSV